MYCDFQCPHLIYNRATWEDPEEYLCRIGTEPDDCACSIAGAEDEEMILETEAAALAAVEQNDRALWMIPEALRTEAICEAAIKQNGEALDDVPAALRTAALCLAAVEQNGWALQYVPWDLRTAEVCRAAVRENVRALGDVPRELRAALKEAV